MVRAVLGYSTSVECTPVSIIEQCTISTAAVFELQVKQMEETAGGVATAGVALSPQRISNQAARFLRERLRMEHLRQYMLDVLKTYAALQTFQVGRSRYITVYHSVDSSYGREENNTDPRMKLFSD